MDIDKEDPGFGQEEGEAPRLPRVRLELNALMGFMDSDFRRGKAGLSNRMNPQEDLGLPRFTFGARASAVVKIHRYLALGAEYFRFSSEGSKARVRYDIRIGSAPSEVTPFSYVSAAMELQQTNLTIRFVAADDAHIRAEFCGGVTWVSYRLGFHPKLPAPVDQFDSEGRLPGGGQFRGTSVKNEAYLAPAIGTYFVWNFHPNVAIFIDTTSSYFSFWRKFGSIASLNRAGFRFRLFDGLEIVTGVFIASGQVYDVRDRLKFIGIGSSHEFRQASWLAGGPEVGVSFTY